MFSSKWIFGIILGIVIYSIFVVLSDFSLLVEKFQVLKLEYIFLGIIVTFLGLLIRGFRWHLMLLHLNVKISIKHSLLLFFSGLAFGLTPGRMGEVMKSYYLKRLNNTPITFSGPTIIIERFADVFAILTISLFVFLLIGIQHEITIFGFVVLTISLLLVYEKHFLIKVLTKTRSIPIIGRLSKKLLTSFETLSKLMELKLIWKILILSITAWTIESLVVYFILKAFDISISVVKSGFIFVISSLIGALTFLPGGLGGTEGGLLGLLMLENITYDDAVGPILVIRMIVLWMVILFGILMIRITEMTLKKIEKSG